MKKTRILQATALAIVAGLSLTFLSACSERVDTDYVGIYYLAGPSDGQKFDHCFDPGSSDDVAWNNDVYRVPANMRTWYVAPAGTPGADSNKAITVTAKPQQDQPSGVQVDIWSQVNFSLNTYCGADNKDPNSPLIQWWQRIGKRYKADTTEGWKDMLGVTLVSAQAAAARTVAKEYTADELVANTKREEVQARISQLLQDEIKRLTGGDFFCGPGFDRKKPETCGELKFSIIDVDFTNKAVQDARDAKQAAQEKAAALAIEAQGQVDAANKLRELYNNPAWVAMQVADKQKEAALACAQAPNCVLIVGGGNGANVNVNTSTNNR